MSKLTLSFKGQILKVFSIRQGDMLIGSDPACNIHIDSLAIAPQHARVSTTEQTSSLTALDAENNTFINHTQINEQPLKHGDEIRIGKHTLTYQFEEVPEELQVPPTSTEVEDEPSIVLNAPEPAAKPRPARTESTDKLLGWLQIMNGQNLGKTLSLHRSMTNLGKPGVATAVISKRETGYFISHLEGKFLPKIGEQPIEQTTRLSDGDVIQIGNIKMQFYME